MESAIPGTLLAERYLLVRPLGAGGSATVWEATDTLGERPVAVKLLRGAAVNDPTERERLRREARVLARLAHPRICGIRDYLESPRPDGSTVPVLVTELLTGTTLAQRLKEGALPWAQAVHVCAQIADALLAAHHAGVVHRDVKPANVMLVADGAKLLDFGIARGQGDGDLTGNLTVGTPLCMAPEQVRGQRARPASDIYALGCVLFWSLTGRPPYQSNDITEVFEAQLYDPPPPIEVSGLPARVVDFCHACLSKNPAFRPNAAQALTTLSGLAGAAGLGLGEEYGRSAQSGYGGRRAISGFQAVSDPPAAAGSRPAAAALPAASPLPVEETMLSAAFAEDEEEDFGEHGGYGHGGYDSPPEGAAGESAGAGAAFDGRVRPRGQAQPRGRTAWRERGTGAQQNRGHEGGGHQSTGHHGTGIHGAGIHGAGNQNTAAYRERRRGARPVVLGAAALLGLSALGILALELTGGPGAGTGVSAGPGPAVRPPGVTATASAAVPQMSGEPAPTISAAAAADPVRYLEAVRAQIRTFVADGPATLDPTTGGDLQNSIIDIENSVISAKRNGGTAHLREIRQKIAQFDGRLNQLVGRARISATAANQLTSEVQRLSNTVTD